MITEKADLYISHFFPRKKNILRYLSSSSLTFAIGQVEEPVAHGGLGVEAEAREAAAGPRDVVLLAALVEARAVGGVGHGVAVAAALAVTLAGTLVRPRHAGSWKKTRPPT